MSFGFGYLPTLQQRIGQIQPGAASQTPDEDPQAMRPAGAKPQAMPAQSSPTSMAGPADGSYTSDLNTMQTGLPQLGASAGGGASAAGGDDLASLFAAIFGG